MHEMPRGDPPYGPMRGELRRFLADLPLMLGIGAAVTLAFAGWRAIAGDPLSEIALLGVAIFAVATLLTPIGWLRRRGLPERGEVRAWLPLFGVTLAWTLAWIGVIVGALAMAGALGSR